MHVAAPGRAAYDWRPCCASSPRSDNGAREPRSGDVPDPRATLVLAFDTFGDLVLRQLLLTRLADDGRALVAVRRGFDRIPLFLEPRAQVITTDINPHPGDEASGPGWRLPRVALALDRRSFRAPQPDLLDEALFRLTAARRTGFAGRT
jgi:hypothetical protein